MMEFKEASERKSDEGEDMDVLQSPIVSARTRAELHRTASSPAMPCFVADISPTATRAQIQRIQAHSRAFKANEGAFRKRRPSDWSAVTYAEKRKDVRHMLGDLHPDTDHGNIAPPPAGYTERRDSDTFVSFEDSMPPPYDYDDRSIRPRTTGYCPGHVRTVFNKEDYNTLLCMSPLTLNGSPRMEGVSPRSTGAALEGAGRSVLTQFPSPSSPKSPGRAAGPAIAPAASAAAAAAAAPEAATGDLAERGTGNLSPLSARSPSSSGSPRSPSLLREQHQTAPPRPHLNLSQPQVDDGSTFNNSTTTDVSSLTRRGAGGRQTHTAGLDSMSRSLASPSADRSVFSPGASIRINRSAASRDYWFDLQTRSERKKTLRATAQQRDTHAKAMAEEASLFQSGILVFENNLRAQEQERRALLQGGARNKRLA